MYKFEIGQVVQINCPEVECDGIKAKVIDRSNVMLANSDNVYDKLVRLYKLDLNTGNENLDGACWAEETLSPEIKSGQIVAEMLIATFGDIAYFEAVRLAAECINSGQKELAQDYADGAKVLIEMGYHKKGYND